MVRWKEQRQGGLRDSSVLIVRTWSGVGVEVREMYSGQVELTWELDERLRERGDPRYPLEISSEQRGDSVVPNGKHCEKRGFGGENQLLYSGHVSC